MNAWQELIFVTRTPPAQILLAHTFVNATVVIRETEWLAPASPWYRPLHQVRKKALTWGFKLNVFWCQVHLHWGFALDWWPRSIDFLVTGSFSPFVDLNECLTGAHLCDKNATCTKTLTSYICQCNLGYSGNGTTGSCTALVSSTSASERKSYATRVCSPLYRSQHRVYCIHTYLQFKVHQTQPFVIPFAWESTLIVQPAVEKINSRWLFFPYSNSLYSLQSSPKPLHS